LSGEHEIVDGFIVANVEQKHIIIEISNQLELEVESDLERRQNKDQ